MIGSINHNPLLHRVATTGSIKGYSSKIRIPLQKFFKAKIMEAKKLARRDGRRWRTVAWPSALAADATTIWKRVVALS